MMKLSTVSYESNFKVSHLMSKLVFPRAVAAACLFLINPSSKAYLMEVNLFLGMHNIGFFDDIKFFDNFDRYRFFFFPQELIGEIINLFFHGIKILYLYCVSPPDHA